MTSRFRLLIAAATFAVACGGDEEQTEAPVRPVRFVQVFSGGGTRVRTFSGAAQSAVATPLSFRVAGRVQRLPVAVGDRVRGGQLIGELDPADYRLQLQDAEAALRRAQSQARNADAEYDRIRGLYENQNASLSQLDGARTASEAAAEQVQSARNRQALARRQLGYTRLTAPQAGDIASVNIEVNENVRAGQAIVLLTSGSELEVSVAVPEVLIADVREGSRVAVRFDALGGREFGATVTEVSVASTELVTTFPVTVKLDATDPDVRSGMAAEVAFRFTSTESTDLIVVPPIAVAEDQNGRFVYVVEPADPGFGTARRREVTVGELTTDGLVAS